MDKDDLYKHSKWLEFMFRRFLLARDLLAEDGVLLVCINDENRSKLELLLDQALPGMRLGGLYTGLLLSGEKLAVELDSGQHNLPEAREYDAERTAYLNANGIAKLKAVVDDLRKNIR